MEESEYKKQADFVKEIKESGADFLSVTGITLNLLPSLRAIITSWFNAVFRIDAKFCLASE